MEGVLKSWAIPKQPPTRAGIKRLAIQVEDHPLSYWEFEGVIPEGMCGAGRVERWDWGEYELLERARDKLVFRLHGTKLRGDYCLLKFKTKQGREVWLFFKKRG
jgi:DNA ligase D-like protein (predicted 3'-phosphoesterase)